MQDSEPVATRTLTEGESLPCLLTHHLGSGHSVSLWRLPDADEKNLLVNTEGVKFLDEVILEESTPGFVFSPFDNKKPKLFLKGDLIFTFKNGALSKESNSYLGSVDPLFQLPADQKKPSYFFQDDKSCMPTGKNEYTLLVEKCLTGICDGQFEKVVPSRRQSFALPSDFDLLATFHALCETYPHAFISLVSTPETGTWIGATPELLVSIDRHMKFKTVALAGTKVFQPGADMKSIAWTQKDIEEQALVSRYIINCFKKIRLREYDEHGPRTSLAGNLIHLETDYEVDMIATNFPQLGSVMLNLLHPTSAVCGMPLENATKFIKEHEGYDREYYSGYLGPVNLKNESHIFVNLRCMQVQKTTAWCYAGAGITTDSEPEQEWQETEMKMNTLLQVLNR
ncbi:MAG: chorismate-binding protein [Bacteroidota bacterium]